MLALLGPIKCLSEWFKKCFLTIFGTWRSIHVIFHLFKKPVVLVNKKTKRLYGSEDLRFGTIVGPFEGIFYAPVTHILLKRFYLIPKMIVGTWQSTHVFFNLTIRASLAHRNTLFFYTIFYPRLKGPIHKSILPQNLTKTARARRKRFSSSLVKKH